MKNVIVVTLSLLILAAISWAARSDLPVDGKGIRMQTHAINARKNVVLTGVSQTVDMTNDISYSVYAASDIKFRVMSTATKVGAQKTITSGERFTRGVLAGSSFMNFSGGSGELDRQ